MRDIARKKLIVALDVPTLQRAHELVSALRGLVGMFKVGSQLFTAAGPTAVREIIASGEQVFLDLKFHDIPNTVAAAGVEATRLGVSIFNVHAAGGREMMRRTVDAVSREAESQGIGRPAIIAVTVLTSVDEQVLSEIGIPGTPGEQVGRLAALAEASGLDGVVASPHEIGVVRSAVSRTGFLVITPGVRPAGVGQDDQKRVLTPRATCAAGADYLVVGRPITAAPDPAQVAGHVLDEMVAALADTEFKGRGTASGRMRVQ